MTKAKSTKGFAFEIVQKKSWRKERGSIPSRIVLIKWFKHGSKEVREYSTHIEGNRDGEQELYVGHYYETLADAKKDFERRGL